MFLNCVFVGCGGFIGSVLRYLCSFFRLEGVSFPIITMCVNVIGSFALMFFAVALAQTLQIEDRAMLFLRVGLCGGFTTFSTFSAETLGLIEQGDFASALAYAILSVILCVCAAFLGEFAGNSLAG